MRSWVMAALCRRSAYRRRQANLGDWANAAVGRVPRRVSARLVSDGDGERSRAAVAQARRPGSGNQLQGVLPRDPPDAGIVKLVKVGHVVDRLRGALEMGPVRAEQHP